MILLGLSGHGHFDLAAYDAYLAGKLEDPEFSEADMEAAIERLPGGAGDRLTRPAWAAGRAARRARVATSSAASTSATPTSCSALGDSLKISAASATEPTGWTVSSSEVIAAGSRGSEMMISSQPSTCELSASVISQPAPGQCGHQVGVADDQAERSRRTRRRSRSRRTADPRAGAGRIRRCRSSSRKPT